ncbi:DUF5819 family protein [Streptomyces sp. 6N223]|uniref:DUF5819 family protein n=1 Tax=Streptomyces sp. 6N223 TaxID=3457412 RepID=UPI003FD5F8A6
MMREPDPAAEPSAGPGRDGTGRAGAVAHAHDLERTETADVQLGTLPLRSRLIIALALGVLSVYALWHMALVFLFVAPANTLSEEYGEGMREYIYPEFEQTWKLFAPNPLQRNIAIEVRAEAGGKTTDWISLTAMDIEHIEHNLFPSHTAQNELRRAWDFYTGSHAEDSGEPIGLRGEVSEIYVHRIALLRLDQAGDSGIDLDEVERIQLRSATTLLPAPEWSGEEIDTTTAYYELDWWVVTTEDLPSGVLASDGED